MDKFIAWFYDLGQRIRSKSPKFFLVLQYISGTIVALIALALWLNSSYTFEFEKVVIYKQMNLVNLLTDLLKILSSVFVTSMLTISDKSARKTNLKIK